MFSLCSRVMLGCLQCVPGVLPGTSDRSLCSPWQTRAHPRVPWRGPPACSEASWESRGAFLVRDWRSLEAPPDVLVDFWNCSKPLVFVTVSIAHGGAPPLASLLGALWGPAGRLGDLPGTFNVLSGRLSDVIGRKGSSSGTASCGMHVLGPLRWTLRQPRGAVCFADMFKFI